MIAEGYKANLITILRAAKHKDLVLVECQDKATKAIVIVLAAVGSDPSAENGLIIYPLAKMFDGDPYEELNPPSPAGGYES